MWQEIIYAMRLILLIFTGLMAAGGGWWILWYRSRVDGQRRRRQRRRQAEIDSYARLDIRIGEEPDREVMGERVCNVVAENSAFGRVAMLVCDPRGRLKIAADAGMEASTKHSLRAWCCGLGSYEDGGVARIRRGGSGLGEPVGDWSVAVILAERPALLGYERAVVTPMWTMGGRLLGALVVCATA